ncbi:MAG: hypothetical protein V4457_06025 [Pseudomonadota bacterium]
MSRAKRKSRLEQLIASHKRLLRVQRRQIEELGHLRKLLLEIRQEVKTLDPGWAPSPEIWLGRDTLTDGHGNRVDHLAGS